MGPSVNIARRAGEHEKARHLRGAGLLGLIDTGLARMPNQPQGCEIGQATAAIADSLSRFTRSGF